MLLIYDYLVEIIKQHLEERQIEATVIPYINRAWHCYRNIIVHPKELPDNVYYVYINGHWELRFDNPYEEDEVERLRQKLMLHINSNGYLDWHRKDGYQRGYLNIETVVEDKESYLVIFDELWDATSLFLLEGDDNEDIVEYDDESIVENKDADTTFKSLECLVNDSYYQEPNIRLSSIQDLPFERFVIPAYQRPYKWGPKNVNQLINDVITFCEKGTNEYRLGTLVLHQQSLDANAPLNIVDGQQRTITLMLLLNELSKVESYEDLFMGININHFLNKPQFHEITSRMHIGENMNVVRSRLSEFRETHVRFLLKNCMFVVVTLFDVSEAFQFFDSQNARGKELEPHDLLKAFHLREIPKITESDRLNIKDWERLDTPRLANLFLVLFRIKRWIDGNDGREFTTDHVDTFKGPKNKDKILPYQKIYAMAECYTELYNSDLSRKIDYQHMDYPHQIDQVTINGTLFFDMVRYYAQKEKVVEKMLQQYCTDIYQAIHTYAERYRKGDLYTKNLFYTSLLFYYDKFAEEGFSIAVPKIFVWAYGMRLKQTAVRLATMDNLARGNNSFFKVLHSAIAPSDIQNWIIKPIKESENQQKDKMAEITNIFIKLNYLEK